MTRLFAAAAALLLTLTLAACGGDDENAVGTDTSQAGHDMAGMGEMDMSKVGDGRTATLGGYTLAAVKAPRQAGDRGELSFRIDGPNGVQKDFTRQQTKLIHVYLVRTDLTEYQHLHPSIDSSGVWTTDLTVPEPGPYRLVAEFEALTPDGNFEERILGENFTVAGDYIPSTAAPTAGAVTVDGYELTLDGDPKVDGDDLTLRIAKDGNGVTTLEPYLASFAHITGFRAGDLTSVHVHPSNEPDPNDASARGGPDLSLSPMFPEPGRYRLFIQFQTDGRVHLVPMDIEVA